MIGPTALVGPARAHPHAGRHVVGGVDVERVQHRGVGAVELHEHPRERAVERLARAAGRRPTTSCTTALVGDVDEVGQRLVR